MLTKDLRQNLSPKLQQAFTIGRFFPSPSHHLRASIQGCLPPAARHTHLFIFPSFEPIPSLPGVEKRQNASDSPVATASAFVTITDKNTSEER